MNKADEQFKKVFNLKDEDVDEARHNLIGLFQLLLKVDRRINPHLYKTKKLK